nr:hypothetical protein [Tanacetum cinerariifolium]
GQRSEGKNPSIPRQELLRDFCTTKP